MFVSCLSQESSRVVASSPVEMGNEIRMWLVENTDSVSPEITEEIESIFTALV